MRFMFVGDPSVVDKRTEPSKIVMSRLLSEGECAIQGLRYPYHCQYEFYRDEPVEVLDELLSAKLREHNHFAEVPDGDVHECAVSNESPPKARGPGRPRKSVPSGL